MADTSARDLRPQGLPPARPENLVGLSPQMQAIVDFVSGAMAPEVFRERLTAEPEFAQLLDDQAELPEPCYIKDGTYRFLLGLNFSSVAGRLNAQGALTWFLERRAIPVEPTPKYSDLHDLLIDAQPTWLDVNSDYLERYVLPQAPPNLSPSQLKKWLRAKLKELFRCVQKPPRWIQGGCWPIRDDRPLVFLGQFNVSGYFHDEATVYVFHDPEAASSPDECVSVIQTF